MEKTAKSLKYPLELIHKGFIIIEGLDGSGKTTQIQKITEFIKSLSKELITLREPTDLPSGKKLREILTKEKTLSPQEELVLFIEDRESNVKENILPALKEGKIILQDRYIYSNAVYQGMHLGWEEVLRQNIARGFPFPRRTYYLDIPPSECMKRMAQRNEKKTYFEEQEILEKIEKIYKTIAKWDHNLKLIPSQGSVEEVTEYIKKDLEKIL